VGFIHPISGETLRFESPLPPDMARLESLLAKL
jgi:23S rRNA pseudouridine1911/1915/1917 synthase